MNFKIDKDADKAIYEIATDTLKIAIGKNERPKDFAGRQRCDCLYLETEEIVRNLHG